MKLKNLLSLLVFFQLTLFYSCSLQPVVGEDGSKSDSDSNLYLITTNGNLNYLSQNPIDAEYKTFFFLPNETRKIYLGGKLPTSHSNYTSLWLENSSIWNPRYVESIYTSYINSNNYYGIPIGIIDIPIQSGDYAVTAKVGLESGSTYTPYGTKNITFKVSPNYDDRDWGLRVYQQQSYNALDITKDETVSAFKDMNVYLGTSGININNINSNLTDEVVDLDYNGTPVNLDKWVIYAMSKIYPALSVTDAIYTYSQEHPNEGLIFFVKDYNPINFPANKEWLGYTISNAYANGVRKQAPISFIFVKRIKDLFSDNVENQVIKYVTIHELGHLWCEGFTDQATHSLWHNGDNQNICLMKTGISFPTPTGEEEKILNNLVFCEGHLQRGMNVSWHLKQYSPYGEQTAQQSNQILLASNTSFSYQQNQDLEIEISGDKPEIIQGEFIDVLVKVINKSNKTISIGAPKHYLYDYNNDSTFTNHYGEGRVHIEIPPNGSYYFLVDPQDYILFSGMDFSTHTFPPGSYDYYLSLFVGGNEIKSNKINLRVKPIPDSLKQAYEDLKFDTKKYDPNKNYSLEAEKKFEKYKGTYYEKEFYYRLLQTPAYRDDKSGLNINAFENFVLKYPNSVAAYYIFRGVMGLKNDKFIEDIIAHLKSQDPNSKLLMVLKHQPEYMNKQIKHLLK